MAAVAAPAQPAHVSNVSAPASKKIITKLVDSTCLLCGREENRSGNSEKCIRCTECHRESEYIISSLYCIE